MRPTDKPQPVVVQELLRRGAALLTDRRVEAPRLCAERLLAHALDCERVDLYTHAFTAVTREDQQLYAELLQRRIDGEPVQHLTGWTEFWSLRIRCDGRALIPRPETELLVEAALELVNGVARPVIADIATGTGCVAIALATELPRADIYATDISPEALELAMENLEEHDLENRVRLLQGDLTAPLRDKAGAFDLIVSNPPYIPDYEWDGLQPEVRLHDPALALRAGPRGLDVIERLLDDCPALLNPGGHLAMEVSHGHAEILSHELLPARSAWRLLRTLRDAGTVERVVVLECLRPQNDAHANPGAGQAAVDEDGAQRGGAGRADQVQRLA